MVWVTPWMGHPKVIVWRSLKRPSATVCHFLKPVFFKQLVLVPSSDELSSVIPVSCLGYALCTSVVLVGPPHEKWAIQNYCWNSNNNPRICKIVCAYISVFMLSNLVWCLTLLWVCRLYIVSVPDYSCCVHSLTHPHMSLPSPTVHLA